MEINKVAVFCGSSMGHNPIYKEKSVELADYLIQKDIDLIYGAGKVGLMGVIAERMLLKNGNVIGIIPELLHNEEVLHTGLTEVISTKTMSERKVLISKMVDAYIALPGGFGTFDEVFEVLTLQQLFIEQKPVIIFNINGYYDNLIQQLDKMVEDRFLYQRNRDLLLICNSVNELDELLNNYQPMESTNGIDKIIK